MKWAILTAKGNFVTYYTACFNNHPNVLIKEWDSAAVFLRKREAESIIKVMSKNGINTTGYKPVKVLQRLVPAVLQRLVPA